MHEEEIIWHELKEKEPPDLVHIIFKIFIKFSYYYTLLLNDMNSICEIIALQSTLLLIWFETDAIVEYGSIFTKISNLFKLKELEKKREIIPLLTYPTFLSLYYSNFIIKGLTCPICLNTWLSILSYFIFGCSFSVTFCSSLILYYLIVKLKS